MVEDLQYTRGNRSLSAYRHHKQCTIGGTAKVKHQAEVVLLFAEHIQGACNSADLGCCPWLLVILKKLFR